MDVGNPFHFAHIRNMANSDELTQVPPSPLLHLFFSPIYSLSLTHTHSLSLSLRNPLARASSWHLQVPLLFYAVVILISFSPPLLASGMLQSGVSRQLFEKWCEDERNGVVLAGYSVEGTLAKKLLSEPEEITCMDGRIKKRYCAIEYISFSAHVDYIQNSR
jgi:hypothetical protein